jgi:WS/DGAT/MGAT family acyltransferase
MAYAHYERLSALDASFLELEDANAHMHIGSVGIFDAAPVTNESGGLDMERLLALAEIGVRKQERFLQKLAWVPGIGQPIWVDDDRFKLSYHVRHTCLPEPGKIEQLKRLAGRIMSQQLDRGKPLWEIWFVEGLEGGRFAVITKVHHCVADGVTGASLLSGWMGPDPSWEPKPAPEWIPRPAPRGQRMLVGELARRASLPLVVAGGVARALSRRVQGDSGGSPAASVWQGLEGIREAAASVFDPASETIFNVPIGPHRRLDWCRFDLERVRSVKQRLGGTVNDVVLACVADATGGFLQRRGIALDDLDFRVIVPVSLREDASDGSAGNRVSSLIVPLPLKEKDPRLRYKQISESTRALKRSAQRHGAETLAGLADLTFSSLMTRMAQLGLWSRAANMIVTNVSASPEPVYMLGARLLESYPVVPLAASQTLGIALFSYHDGLYWGLNSDWDEMPDLYGFVEGLRTGFEALEKAAAAGPVHLRKRPRKRRKAAAPRTDHPSA